MAVARAVESPLIRGGLTIIAGIFAGNILGFFRVATTAYLLGTGSLADALAVATGPVDTLNQALISAMVFSFVPLLTEQHGDDRIRLFLYLNRLYLKLFSLLGVVVFAFAPVLVRLFAPGLATDYYPIAVNLLRISAVTPVALGLASLYSALLYTDRRFAPSAFHQAVLNTFIIAGAILLWPTMGVYAFAIGSVAGAFVQLSVVRVAAGAGLRPGLTPGAAIDSRALMTKPWPLLLYAGLLALNITLTRAYATHLGPGTAAAFEYCMRCLGVPLALLVSPVSNSLLPEISRLMAFGRTRDAERLVGRTVILVGIAAVAACVFAVLFREPIIAMLFERGSFTSESTRLVSAVFLGFAPSLVGWALLEILARSLFAMNQASIPVAASSLPLIVNTAFFIVWRGDRPELLGMGASIGLWVGFVTLLTTFRKRRELEEAAAGQAPPR
jgi:putative peptidoglycan lipid II flippase